MLDTKKIEVPKNAVRQNEKTPGAKTLPSVAQGNGLNVKQLKSPSLVPTAQLKAEEAPKEKKEEKVYRKTW